MIADTITTRCCTELIRALLTDQPMVPLPEGVSMQNLFAFSKYHGVESMVFHALSLQEVSWDPVNQKSWSSRADMLLTQSIVQLAERDAIIAAMTGAGIPILPVKGSWLKELYPQIDYRQMSDLDMLIHPEDVLQAEQVMLQLGYVVGEEVTTYHLNYTKKPYMEVELHMSLLPETDPNYSYYENVWEKATPVEENPLLFQLSAEDSYIYYLLHLQHHVLFAGTGIRSVLDSQVYRQSYPQMDQQYLAKEYARLGIGAFVRQIEQLCDCWFSSGNSVPPELKKLEKMILTSGTYGTEERQFRLQMAKANAGYTNPMLSSIRYWCSRFFLPRKEMEKEYPILQKLPVLLPVIWFVRLFAKLCHHPGALLRHIRLVHRLGRENSRESIPEDSGEPR